ncbi:Tyrosine kinase receptor Cad96Ca [Blattella germanica]|nr:Tyrosine kinase receptor Cad96Ca [Blattella germanica]
MIRNWVIQDTVPLGEIVARVRAEDSEMDRLVYGLEPKFSGGGAYNKPLPFVINNTTGIVKVNDSLLNRGGEQFLLYVTVSDGKLTSKNEVWVKIVNSSADPDSSNINSGGPPLGAASFLPKFHSQYPGGGNSGGGIFPPPNLQGFSRKPRPPPPPPPPPLTPEQTQTSLATQHEPTKAETAETPTPPPTSNGTLVTPAEGTVTSVPDLGATVIPISVVCGLVIIGGLGAWLFRRKLCRHRNKANKDDMQKEPSGGIVLEEPMALQHWRGPRAHSNRYEGWDRDSNQQQAPGPGIPKPDDRWEFPRHRLKVFNILGEGSRWHHRRGSEDPQGERVGQGAFRPGPGAADPLFVIMEYVPHGKLQSFLRNSRAERYYGNLHGPSNTLTSRDLTSFVYQVARGMEFLSSKGIIHRDLAARNVLVGENHVCKVADFGFARDVISSHVYERKSEGRLPIRWMAPESLYDNIFSVKSDVWSFGVLIWEIVTLGSTPYPGLAAAEVMKRVRDGFRLDKPEHCRRELYNIMYYCWDKDPKERPSFGELVKLLEQLLLTETEYIELERFPDHSYYNMVSLSDEKL